MARRIDVCRLDKEELSYELNVRGIATGLVDEMRARLSFARQMEKSGESLHYPDYPYTFDEDARAVEAKLREVESMLTKFSEGSKSSLFLKLQSKLSHVLGRIDNMVAKDEEQKKLRSEILGLALTFMDSLISKAAEKDKKQHLNPLENIPPNLSVLEGAVAVTASQPPLSTSSPIERGHHLTLTNFNIKPILPHKWNLKFNGDRRGSSVTAFFERVEEMRIARNVAKEILLDSGIDLFEGRAYEFFRDCRPEVGSWDELVYRFKEEYQPVYYSEKLLDEIKGRTQGQDETISTYLAVMAKYFHRLQCDISEEAKLSIVLRNIAPIYRNQLGAIEITSIGQLRTLCKRIEHRLQFSEYVPSPKKSQLLEPDLAYVGIEDSIDALQLSPTASSSSQMPSCSSQTPVVRNQNSQEIVCYKCGQPGHRAIGCAVKSGKICFKCKREGFTVRTCPSCSVNCQQRH